MPALTMQLHLKGARLGDHLGNVGVVQTTNVPEETEGGKIIPFSLSPRWFVSDRAKL